MAVGPKEHIHCKRTGAIAARLLFNNKESDENLPNMWAQFKKGRLHKNDIRIAIEDIKDNLNEDVREKIFDRSELANKVIERLWNLSLTETLEETCFINSLRESAALEACEHPGP